MIDWHNEAMKLSVRTKYFLIFLSVSLLIVIIMLLFTRWSIHRGFTAFLEDRQSRRMEQITERLIEHYEYSSGWHQVRTNRRLWLALLFGPEPRHMGHESREHDRFKHRRLPFQRLLLAGNNDQQGAGEAATMASILRMAKFEAKCSC